MSKTGKKYERYFVNKIKLERGIRSANLWFTSGDYLLDNFSINTNFTKYLNCSGRAHESYLRLTYYLKRNKVPSYILEDEYKILKSKIISLLDGSDLDKLKLIYRTTECLVNKHYEFRDKDFITLYLGHHL